MILKIKNQLVFNMRFQTVLNLSYHSEQVRDKLYNSQKITLSLKKGKKRVLVKGVLRVSEEYLADYTYRFQTYEFEVNEGHREKFAALFNVDNKPRWW